MSDTTGTDRRDGLRRATIDTPIGRLRVAVSERGIRSIDWPAEDRAGEAHGDPPGDGRQRAPDDPILRAAVTQLGEYFDGDRVVFDVDLDPVGTEFQQRAWAALREIPFGETVSYGEQADRMGDRSKARAVGAANGKNPIPVIVPCHRVVGSDGSLTGFAGGLDAKRWLLDHEARVAGRTLV